MWTLSIDGQEFTQSGIFPHSPLLRSEPYHLSSDDEIQIAINALIDRCGTADEKNVDRQLLEATATDRVIINIDHVNPMQQMNGMQQNPWPAKLRDFLYREWGLFRRGISQTQQANNMNSWMDDSVAVLQGLRSCLNNIHQPDTPTEQNSQRLHEYCLGTTPQNMAEWGVNESQAMTQQLGQLVDHWRAGVLIPCIHGEEDHFTTRNLYETPIDKVTLLNGTQGLPQQVLAKNRFNTYTSCSIGASQWNRVKSIADNHGHPFYLALIFGEGGRMTTGTVSPGGMYAQDGVEVIFDQNARCRVLDKVAISWQKDDVDYDVRMVAVRTIND